MWSHLPSLDMRSLVSLRRPHCVMDAVLSLTPLATPKCKGIREICATLCRTIMGQPRGNGPKFGGRTVPSHQHMDARWTISDTGAELCSASLYLCPIPSVEGRCPCVCVSGRHPFQASGPSGKTRRLDLRPRRFTRQLRMPRQRGAISNSGTAQAVWLHEPTA